MARHAPSADDPKRSGSQQRLNSKQKGQESESARGQAQTRIGSIRDQLLANPHDREVPPSALEKTAQHALVYAFVGMLLVVLMFILMNRWRRGVFVLGVAMVHLAVIRWLVDSKILGVLAVRSRKFDSIFNACLGLAMMLIAFGVDPLSD